MKKLYLLLLVFVSLTSFGQIQRLIPYQGTISDSSGKAFSGNFDFRFTIYDASNNQQWTSGTVNLAVVQGAYSVVLGGTSQPTLPTNLLQNDVLFLEIQFNDGVNGTETLAPRIQMLPVPYALRAAIADSVISTGGGFGNGDSIVLKDINGKPRIVLNPNSGEFKMLDDDTVWFSNTVNSPRVEIVKTDNGFVKRHYSSVPVQNQEDGTFMEADGPVFKEETFVNDGGTPKLVKVSESFNNTTGAPDPSKAKATSSETEYYLNGKIKSHCVTFSHHPRKAVGLCQTYDSTGKLCTTEYSFDHFSTNKEITDHKANTFTSVVNEATFTTQLFVDIFNKDTTKLDWGLDGWTIETTKGAAKHEFKAGVATFEFDNGKDSLKAKKELKGQDEEQNSTANSIDKSTLLRIYRAKKDRLEKELVGLIGGKLATMRRRDLVFVNGMIRSLENDSLKEDKEISGNKVTTTTTDKGSGKKVEQVTEPANGKITWTKNSTPWFGFDCGPQVFFLETDSIKTTTEHKTTETVTTVENKIDKTKLLQSLRAKKDRLERELTGTLPSGATRARKTELVFTQRLIESIENDSIKQAQEVSNRRTTTTTTDKITNDEIKTTLEPNGGIVTTTGVKEEVTTDGDKVLKVYTYDGLNKVVNSAFIFSGGDTVGVTYDMGNRVIVMQTNAVVTDFGGPQQVFEYDANENVVRHVVQEGSNNVGMEYDAIDRVIRVTPNSKFVADSLEATGPALVNGPMFINGLTEINNNLQVNGNVSKFGGTFRIDHPLDPENKYLTHSFVESPDMMNIYNGNATTDKDGKVTITMPSYFQALNMEFRYQLTCIGQFAQAIVLKEIESNTFVIQTDKPNVKVSWQVTGVRQDDWANDNRIIPEKEKEASKKGKRMYTPKKQKTQ